MIYVMDVSGSMGKEQKEIVRLEAFWIDTWLRANYKHLETRFIIHDASAREVDRDTFFRTRESGGTLISSAYRAVDELITAEYPPEEWNLYVFQFSDGDNWSSADTAQCMSMLRERLVPRMNLFCYGQVESEYGSGQYIGDLETSFKDNPTVVLSRIPDRTAIMQSIRDPWAGEIAWWRASSSVPTGPAPELEDERQRIQAIALAHGLDIFETVFEMCDYDEINMLAAYGGFPTRYPHWRWGMEYLQMQKGYEYGLQKIYEMVINTNPAYAYLLDNNLFVDQKLVMAHVFGHVDFFKNNLWFAPTNRKMLDAMADHAVRVRRIVDRVGESPVEAWLDVCLSCDNLIDPFLHHIRRDRKEDTGDPRTPSVKFAASRYMDSYINPPAVIAAEEARLAEARSRPDNFPENAVRDVLGFVLEHGRMAGWQRDCLDIVRNEAYYFVPQMQTKVMNEGWASFWHTRLMTGHILTDSEVVDYCDHHSGTVAMRPGQLNPYKVGIEVWRDVERRWNRGQFGKDYRDCEDGPARRDWDTGAGLGKEKSSRCGAPTTTSPSSTSSSRRSSAVGSASSPTSTTAARASTSWRAGTSRRSRRSCCSCLATTALRA